MNLGEARGRVRDSIAAVSTELETQIDTFLQDSVLEIATEGPWPWEKKASTFLARGDLALTCTWTQGATTLTVDSGEPATQAIADEYIGGLIKVNAGSIYEITDWVVATSTITVSTAIVEANGSAAACSVVQDLITLPGTVDSVVEIGDPVYGWRLTASDSMYQRRWPDPFLVIGGQPRTWWTRGISASGSIEIVLHPPPDDDRVYTYTYWSTPLWDTSGGDATDLEVVTGIPSRWHQVIVAGAKYRAYEFEFEAEGQKSAPYAEFLRGISRMKEGASPNLGAIKKLRSPRRRRYNPFGRQDAYWPTDRIDGV